MISYLSDNFCHSCYMRVNLRSALLQTVWIQVRSNKLSDLIIIQTFYHSDGIPELNPWNATLDIVIISTEAINLTILSNEQVVNPGPAEQITCHSFLSCYFTCYNKFWLYKHTKNIKLFHGHYKSVNSLDQIMPALCWVWSGSLFEEINSR